MVSSLRQVIDSAVKIAMGKLTPIWNAIAKNEIDKQINFDYEMAKATKKVQAKVDRKFNVVSNKLNKDISVILKQAKADGILDKLDLKRNKGTKKISIAPISALNFTSYRFVKWCTENRIENQDWDTEGRARYSEFNSGKVLVQDNTHATVYGESLAKQKARLKKQDSMK